MVVSEAFSFFKYMPIFLNFDLHGGAPRFVVFCLGKTQENVKVLGMEMVTILRGSFVLN